MENSIVQGDFNVKVGDDQRSSWPEVLCKSAKFGLGRANDRVKQLLQCCVINDIVITNTVFQQANTRRVTWISPDEGITNQIDNILVHTRLNDQLKNFKAYISAELGSDHFLIIANVDIKPCVSRSHREIVMR